MKVGDFVKIFWIENGIKCKDCLFKNNLGTVLKIDSKFATVKIKNKYSKIVVRKFSKDRIQLVYKSLF